jgi:YCII-related domain
VQDGKTLTTDGPFVEIKEAIGGYLHFEADDLDAAIELAAQIPAARMGGAIEFARSWSGSDPRAGLPRSVGPRPRCSDRLPRRLRPRRGSRAGGVRGRRGALAT